MTLQEEKKIDSQPETCESWVCLNECAWCGHCLDLSHEKSDQSNCKLCPDGKCL
jgi:hypothetical protein